MGFQSSRLGRLARNGIESWLRLRADTLLTLRTKCSMTRTEFLKEFRSLCRAATVMSMAPATTTRLSMPVGFAFALFPRMWARTSLVSAQIVNSATQQFVDLFNFYITLRRDDHRTWRAAYDPWQLAVDQIQTARIVRAVILQLFVE